MGAGADFLADFSGRSRPGLHVFPRPVLPGPRCFALGAAINQAGSMRCGYLGGPDSLCGLTVNGFTALESISSGLCKPFGRHLDAITVGGSGQPFCVE